MPYIANVHRILIASPSDVKKEREAVCQVIHKWNTVHASEQGIFLEAVRWETHSHPEMGERAQAILNKQIVDKCDMVIGIFGKRFGSPTGKADSGTKEEIERFLTAKKPIMLYFQESSVTRSTLKQKQHRLLKRYKLRCMKNGVIEKYTTVENLKRLLHDHLIRLIQTISKNSFLPVEPGMRRTLTMWAGKVSDDFLLKENPLSILLKDGHTFFRTKGELLKRRFLSAGKMTNILILHPDYKYIGAVADMDPHKKGFPKKQRVDCLDSIRIMHGIRNAIRAEMKIDIAERVLFLGFKTIPTWNGFISATQAIIHIYPTFPHRGDLQTLEIASKDHDGNLTQWYEKYRTEFQEIVRMVEGESEDCDLWNYRLPSVAT